MNITDRDLVLEEVVSYMVEATFRHIRKNYGFNIIECNENIIHLAEKYLEIIRTSENVKSLNRALEELFSTLPRKPKNKQKRKELLAERIEDRDWIYERERNLLDMVKSVLPYMVKVEKKKDNPLDIIQQAGVELKKVEWKTERVIQDMARHYPGKIRGIYEVIRKNQSYESRRAFESFNVWYSDDIKRLFTFLMLGSEAESVNKSLLFDSCHKKCAPVWDSYHNVTIAFLLSMNSAVHVGILNDIDLYRKVPDISPEREYMVIFSR